MARLNIGSGASATITDVNGGNIVGADSTSTVTTANQISGGRSSNITWLSVPTNTSDTRHSMAFGNSVNLELTNSGAVSFASTASGTVSVTAGPPNTAVSNLYDTTSGTEDYFSITSTRTTTDTDDNVEQEYDIVSDGTDIASDADIANLSLTGGARYHSVTNTDDSITLYRIGTEQASDQTTASVTDDGVTTVTTVDFYSLKIETKAENAVITLGGISLTNEAPLPDDGVNYTDNVVVQEKPFTVTVNFPEDYGYAAVELPSGVEVNTVTNSGSTYSSTTNFFSITSNSDGDELTYDIVSPENDNVTDGAIADLKGLNRTNFDDRYHQDGGIIYRIGTEQTADESTDGDGNVTVYYSLIEELNSIGLDQVLLTDGDTMKIACVKVGLAPFYASINITGNDQTVDVNPEIQDYSQTAVVPSGTEVTSVAFDTVTNLLDIICTNVRQEGDVMNNILTESLFGPGTNRADETVEAMLYFESSDIYRTVNNAIFINSDRVRLTSSTASAAATKETMAYFTPTTASATDLDEKLYNLTLDDDYLGQSVIRTDFTSGDLSNELNRRRVTEGTLQNAQLNVPAFGEDQ